MNDELTEDELVEVAIELGLATPPDKRVYHLVQFDYLDACLANGFYYDNKQRNWLDAEGIYFFTDLNDVRAIQKFAFSDIPMALLAIEHDAIDWHKVHEVAIPFAESAKYTTQLSIEPERVRLLARLEPEHNSDLEKNEDDYT